MNLSSAVRLGALAIVDGAAVVGLTPDWPPLARNVSSANSWVAQVGADGAVADLAATALWLCAVWVAIGLSAALLVAAPGRVGAAGHRLARQLLPATMLRLIAAATGLSILIIPVAASAHPSSPSISSTRASATSVGADGTARPGPSWPTAARPVPRLQVGWATSSPAASSNAAPAAPRPTIASPTAPHPAVAAPTSPHHTTSAPIGVGHAPAGSAATVVVAPGDCLWKLAAADRHDRTEREIAAEVARWYAANRATIGPDPSLLYPGQVLIQPR